MSTQHIKLTSEPNPYWMPVKFTTEKTYEKLEKNIQKAVLEHFSKNTSCTISPKDPLPDIEWLGKTKNLTCILSYGVAESQGSRNSMEDAYLYHETLDWTLVGVCDGHFSNKVAVYIKASFPEFFKKALKETEDNIRYALETATYNLHHSIKDGLGQFVGATVVICYLVKKTSDVYTMTLGGCEAKIYHNQKAIPLSVVRDWGSKKDAKRASVALNNPEIEKKWLETKSPRTLRFPSPYGSNVSRAIGDGCFNIYQGKPGISYKPKITWTKFRAEDTLILASEPFWSSLKEDQILDILKANTKKNGKEIAELLLKLALETLESNITIMVVCFAKPSIESANHCTHS